MEKPAEEATGVEVIDIGDVQPSEQTRVRRRLVQSTLFPHRSQDNGKESVIKEDENCDEDEDQDDEENEYCGSQSKKKRKQKPKAMPQSRASKKVAVNGNETLGGKVDDKDSPVIDKSNFFSKVSERRQRHQNKRQKEQPCVGSPEDNDNTCSPPESASKDIRSPRQLRRRVNTTPQKRRVSTTPKKKVRNSDIKEEHCRQNSTNPSQCEHASQPTPDLRLEAKMSAEENSRIFAGRQIHPFFSSWKMGKRNQETDTVENKWCFVERKEKSITFSPIHVFEKARDDAVSLDWGNWMFTEGSFISTNSGLESECSPVFEGSVNSLCFDNLLSASDPTGSSLLHNEVNLDQHHILQEVVSLDQSSIQRDYLHAISSTLLADEQMTHLELVKDIEVDHKVVKIDFFSGKAGCVRSPDVEWQGRFLQERMMPYYHGCGNQPENSLWTNKYQPEKAIEVCGNSESVKSLSEWLHLWNERGYRTGKDSTNGDKRIMQDADYNCYQSDCDSENINETITLKNVLLVTGPVGSGKSAAIYACAKEQGFQVIEVNASDWRNGTLVKQRFGEAVESHWLQWTPENHVVSESKLLLKSSQAIPNTTAAQESNNEVIELIPLSDEEDSQNAHGIPGKFTCKENRTASYKSETKTLILFEDVDATLYEDRGFIGTIQQLAETAKRPMILTSNSNNPVLPNNLDRLEVCFTLPSMKELLHHVFMVCAAEKVNIQPCLLERFIGYCQGDIRKTIMHLQFWCQGQRCRKDSKVQRAYGPLLFDLDAGHRILPKIIPWGYHSQLSETVEKEITRSLLMMEESSSLMEVVEEEELNHNEMQNSSKMHKNDPDSIEAKKEAMLSRHFCIHNEDEFAAQFPTACEFSNSSGSPVAFARRNVRRKLDTVLSSNSGDEWLDDGFPVVSGIPYGDTNNEIFLEVNSKSPPHCLATERCFNPLSEQLLHSEGQKLVENHYDCSEPADYTQLNGTCKSVEISCVPESSFVPETEINDGMVLFSRTVSCGHIADIAETVSASSDLMQNLLPVEANDLNKSLAVLHKNSEMMGNTCDMDTESVEGEEVGDSHIERMESVPRGYQVMDECSRMDFRRIQCMEKPRSWMVTDSVQETWRRLRVCHTDLRKYVTPELKDASHVLKLAYRMSNLISEADLLLGDCQPLICDYLEPAMVPCEKSHAFSWHDDQLQMTSTIAQHGICFYANEIDTVGSKMGSSSRVDLAWEMLASSTNTMALGKLVSQDRRTIRSLETESPPKSGDSLKSEFESCLRDIVQSIIPQRSYLALKGDAFPEYLSSLSQISRSEASRLSESIDKTKKRRVRVARHYLSSGALMLSPEDISLLGQCNCYRKVTSQSMDASFR
uniref:AAA+ ATPase domain-containing protein n=1 Tax=Davidia involucrata TaxID=16924 RepID=A0A5B7B8E5_DAVIN